jgi:[ribosomal protein S5]-alanine N-acetyltransferase
LRGARLTLTPLAAEALDALADGDRPRLERATGARFGDPLGPPPLLDDHLDTYRAGLRLGHPEPAWQLWLMVAHATGDAVGVAGLSGPVLAGVATLGWSVYPAHQGQGYATEALSLLVEHLLAAPGVTLVRATIDPANAASRRVAEKVGLRESGMTRGPEDEPMIEVCVRRRRPGRR